MKITSRGPEREIYFWVCARKRKSSATYPGHKSCDSLSFTRLNTETFILREKVRQEMTEVVFWSSFERLSTCTMQLFVLWDRYTWRHDSRGLGTCCNTLKKLPFNIFSLKRVCETEALMDILKFKLNSLGGCRHGWVTFRFLFTLPPSTHFYYSNKDHKNRMNTFILLLFRRGRKKNTHTTNKGLNQHLHQPSIVWRNTPGPTW